MRRSFVGLAFVLMLGVFGSAPTIAREGPTSASLLGQLTTQPTVSGMTISGTIQKVPAGTKMWVIYLVYKAGGPPKFVSEDSNVIVSPDGTFHANLLNPSGAAFKPGSYEITIESHFNSIWQTVDVLQKAGVELDSRGRSNIYTDPKAIPPSPDFKPNDPEFPNAGRYISVIREVKLGSLPADLAAIEGVKGATLLVQGRGRSSLSVGKSVEWFASVPSGGFKPIAWSATLVAGGIWAITLDCIDGEKQKKAQWSYDPKLGTVKYLDPLAKTLSYVPEE